MKTLVLGASLNSNRYSNLALRKFVENKFDTVGVGLKQGNLDDIMIYTGMPQISDIHTVTIYLNSRNQKKYYDYIISLKPERVIFNPGTHNLEFENLLKKNGISFENSCTLVLLSTMQY